MAPREQWSERRLATTSCDDSEANWNGRTGRQTDRQDHALSQDDALTKNAAKRDSAGAVCNSGMGMLFFNVFYFEGICKI